MNRVPVYAANWKMNKALSETEAFVGALRKRLSELPRRTGTDYEVVVATGILQSLATASAPKGPLPR